MSVVGVTELSIVVVTSPGTGVVTGPTPFRDHSVCHRCAGVSVRDESTMVERDPSDHRFSVFEVDMVRTSRCRGLETRIDSGPLPGPPRPAHEHEVGPV